MLRVLLLHVTDEAAHSTLILLPNLLQCICLYVRTYLHTVRACCMYSMYAIRAVCTVCMLYVLYVQYVCNTCCMYSMYAIRAVCTVCMLYVLYVQYEYSSVYVRMCNGCLLMSLGVSVVWM